ncbi:unnamed protein product, partial [Heligmosomoides polygyrus]|uniref:Choline/ethanolamine kinase n=1 Tax=Heligmosomoides polygyrus TaxID=6339 RepID=A0A183GUS5_HELPZ
MESLVGLRGKSEPRIEFTRQPAPPPTALHVPFVGSWIVNGSRCITPANMPTEMLKYFKSHDVLDLRSKILSLCADVLGGKWAEVRPESVSITHVRGGLTNLVYLVSRPTFSVSDDEQPSTVLLRIQSQTDNEKLLTELVVFTSLAESGLGPKLLGIFPGGRFEEYIPSRHVSHHEVTDS